MKQSLLSLSLALATGIATAWTTPMLTPSTRSLSTSRLTFKLSMTINNSNDDDDDQLGRRDFFHSTVTKAASISLLAVATSFSSVLDLTAVENANAVDSDIANADVAPASATTTSSSSTSSSYSKVYLPAPHSMDGKLVVITGGNTGLGLESTKRLAKAGAFVIFTSRDDIKGAKAVDEVNTYLNECRTMDSAFVGKVAVANLDLCDMDNVKSFKDRLLTIIGGKGGEDIKIDVLMNNAGVMAIPNRQLTKDGYERTFQTNHLGHFALTAMLLPLLSHQGRIINVSSMGYQFASSGGLQLDNLNGERDYGPWLSYGQSKLENILFTNELQKRASTSNDWKDLMVYSLHPGAVQTDLARYLIGEEKYVSMKENRDGSVSGGGGGSSSWTDKFVMQSLALFVKTVQEGASTQIYLASSADIRPETGGLYYSDGRVNSVLPFAKDEVKAKELWTVSEDLSGVKFNL